MKRERPFLKWAGNKYRVLPHIQAVMPSGKRLVEPFVGSGAVFLNLNFPRYVIAETNPDLVHLYRYIKREGEGFIQYAKRFMRSKNNNAEKYYHYRNVFNTTDDQRLKSALFIYLNRHGYNGLCRYNQSWGFNVPFGSHKKIYFPEKELNLFHAKLKRASVACQDFRQTMALAKPGDVIYCDPPYVPLSPTANFTTYGAQSFGEADQIDLVNLAKDCSRRGIPVIISNHDTAFTRKIYRGAELISFNVQRNISQKANGREKVKEILAIY